MLSKTQLNDIAMGLRHLATVMTPLEAAADIESDELSAVSAFIENLYAMERHFNTLANDADE